MEVWNSVIIIYFLAFIGQIKLSSFQAFNVSECVQNVLIQNCKEGPDNTESLKSVILHHQHRFSPLTYNAALNNFLTKHFFETQLYFLSDKMYPESHTYQLQTYGCALASFSYSLLYLNTWWYYGKLLNHSPLARSSKM